MVVISFWGFILNHLSLTGKSLYPACPAEYPVILKLTGHTEFTCPSLHQLLWPGQPNMLTGLAEVQWVPPNLPPHHIHTPVEIRLNVMVFLVYTGWSQTRLCLYSKENGKAQRFVIFLNHSQRQPGGWMSTQSSAK